MSESLQFAAILPLCGFITAKGMVSGIYEVIPFGKDGSIQEKAWAPEFAGVLKLVAAEIEPNLSAWLGEGGALPAVGYEHMNAQEEIVAEAELVWESDRIAGLLEDQLEYQAVFEKQGWQVVILDTEGCWLSAAALSALHGGKK